MKNTCPKETSTKMAIQSSYILTASSVLSISIMKMTSCITLILTISIATFVKIQTPLTITCIPEYSKPLDTSIIETTRVWKNILEPAIIFVNSRTVLTNLSWSMKTSKNWTCIWLKHILSISTKSIRSINRNI